MSTEIGVMIRLRLSSGMTPEAAVAEVRRSVEFGQPEVSLIYIMEDLPGDQES